MGETPRRTQVTDAAIATLAREGGRGLTHRAVDRAAGLPEGSTSYYFRTRERLVGAVAERMSDLDRELLPALPASSADAFADGLAEAVAELLGPRRDRLLARYELVLEATRRPAVRDVMTSSNEAVRAAVADRLAALGAGDASRAAGELLACLDGLLLAMAADGMPPRDGDNRELRDVVRRLVAFALSGGPGASAIDPPTGGVGVSRGRPPAPEGRGEVVMP